MGEANSSVGARMGGDGGHEGGGEPRGKKRMGFVREGYITAISTIARNITMSESKMYVIVCFVRDHDTRFSLGFLHPALHSTQGDLYNTYQPREQQK